MSKQVKKNKKGLQVSPKLFGMKGKEQGVK